MPYATDVNRVLSQIDYMADLYLTLYCAVVPGQGCFSDNKTVMVEMPWMSIWKKNSNITGNITMIFCAVL